MNRIWELSRFAERTDNAPRKKSKTINMMVDRNLIKGFLIRAKPNVGPNLMLLVILATFCSEQVVAAAVDVCVIINIVGLHACQPPKGFWNADRNYGVEEQQGYRMTEVVTMESSSKTWLAQRCIFFQKKQLGLYCSSALLPGVASPPQKICDISQWCKYF